jgi:anti-sigma factor RsiW
MKSNMCDEMPELISLYLDDELDEVARSRMRRHTVACAMCGPLFAELQAVDTLFKNAPLMAAPEDFTDRAVKAAFQSSFQENLRFGMVTLLLATAALISFILLGNAATLTALFSPNAFTGMELWLPQFVETLQVFGRVMFGALTTVSEVMAAPLMVMLIGGLVSAYMLAEILKRTRVQMTA